MACIADRYYWPNLYDNITWNCRSCNVCQFRAKNRMFEPLSITLSPTVFHCFILNTIHMPKGYSGKKYLLHASCATGKWPEAYTAHKNDSHT